MRRPVAFALVALARLLIFLIPLIPFVCVCVCVKIELKWNIECVPQNG